ncbi:MAG: FadR/GntR family transcriptional regulator [Thermomicrobiales bacterium]
MSWPTVSPPARNRLVESLAEQIADLIWRQQMRPGDRLPSVRALATQLQVAVPTLREAIRRMEAFGMVEIRHGAGIFVRSPQPRVMVAKPGPGAIDSQVVLDLLDTRLLFEPYCAEQAAQYPAHEEVAQLTALLERAEQHLGGNDRMLQETNMAFHAGIARCSGNVVLVQVMESLADLYASEQAAMLTIANARVRDHREHLAILVAIQDGDPRRARSLMRRHLLSVKTQMAARLAADAHARKVEWLSAAAGRA